MSPSLSIAFAQFKRLFQLIRPYRRRVVVSVLLSPLLGLLGMVTPFLTQQLIDKVYPHQDWDWLYVVVIGMLVMGISSSVLQALQGFYSVYIHQLLNGTVELYFFNHLQHLKARFFEENRVGEIMSRFQDVSQALSGVTKVLQTVFGQGFYLLIVPPFLLFLQWKLALVSLISLPLTVLLTTFTGKIMRKHWLQSAEASADLNAFQTEALSQMRTIKGLGLERHIFQKTQTKLHHSIETQLNAMRLGQRIGVINGVIYALNTTIYTYFGWSLILTGELSLGTYMAFSAYIGYLYSPLQGFVNLFSEFQQSAIHLKRMFEYLDKPTEQTPQLVYVAASPQTIFFKGNFSIKNVSFGYTPEIPILENFSLDIPAGSMTAIVGASGSGKTTLLRLLSRFDEPDSGSITLDGRNLANIPLDTFRQQVAVVWQDSGLFNGTFYENLTMGMSEQTRATLSDERLAEVIEICQLSELIAELPLAYETPIGEWGAGISAGQKQRICIARALLRNTPILLLDEATANVDMHTENAILERLKQRTRKQKGEQTIIYITHRLSTTHFADQVVEIGEMVEGVRE